MSNIPFDLVIFDLDGTLADTAPDLAASLNHALEALDRPGVPPENVRHLVGHGAKALLRKGLGASGEAPEELVERGYPYFLEYYDRNICNGTTAYPGVEEALDLLAGEGAALALCTNKPEALSRKLVEALGWNGRFKAIVCGDTLPVRKPDPAMLHQTVARAGRGRAVFVGDSIIDADTAKAAHVPFVAVSFGFSDRPAADLGAAAVIDHYRELVPTLARLKTSTIGPSIG